MIERDARCHHHHSSSSNENNRGPRGPRGFPGATGVGITGVTGAGPTGATGAGPTGPTGPTGAGPTGPTGVAPAAFFASARTSETLVPGFAGAPVRFSILSDNAVIEIEGFEYNLADAEFTILDGGSGSYQITYGFSATAGIFPSVHINIDGIPVPVTTLGSVDLDTQVSATFTTSLSAGQAVSLVTDSEITLGSTVPGSLSAFLDIVRVSS